MNVFLSLSQVETISGKIGQYLFILLLWICWNIVTRDLIMNLHTKLLLKSQVRFWFGGEITNWQITISSSLDIEPIHTQILSFLHHHHRLSVSRNYLHNFLYNRNLGAVGQVCRFFISILLFHNPRTYRYNIDANWNTCTVVIFISLCIWFKSDWVMIFFINVMFRFENSCGLHFKISHFQVIF